MANGRCGKCAEDKRITDVFRKLSIRSSYGQFVLMIRFVNMSYNMVLDTTKIRSNLLPKLSMI